MVKLFEALDIMVKWVQSCDTHEQLDICLAFPALLENRYKREVSPWWLDVGKKVLLECIDDQMVFLKSK